MHLLHKVEHTREAGYDNGGNQCRVRIESKKLRRAGLRQGEKKSHVSKVGRELRMLFSPAPNGLILLYAGYQKVPTGLFR